MRKIFSTLPTNDETTYTYEKNTTQNAKNLWWIINQCFFANRHEAQGYIKKVREEKKESFIVKAWKDNRIIGFAFAVKKESANFINEDELCIELLGVLKKHSNKGVGKNLLIKCLEKQDEMGCSSVTGDVAIFNTPSLKMVLSQGFLISDIKHTAVDSKFYNILKLNDEELHAVANTSVYVIECLKSKEMTSAEKVLKTNKIINENLKTSGEINAELKSFYIKNVLPKIKFFIEKPNEFLESFKTLKNRNHTFKPSNGRKKENVEKNHNENVLIKSQNLKTLDDYFLAKAMLLTQSKMLTNKIFKRT